MPVKPSLLIVSALTMWVHAPCVSAETRITIRKMQKLALKHSLTTDLAIRQIEIGKLRESTARRTQLPDLSWNSQLQRQYRESNSDRSVGGGNGPYSTEQSHVLSLDYVLYDFGKQSSVTDAASAQRELLENDHRDATIAVVWGVAQAAHNLLTAENLIHNLLQQQDLLKGRLDKQKQYYKQGLKSETDVVASEIDFNRNLLALEQTRTEKRTILSQLMNLLNLPESQSSIIAESLKQLPEYDLSMTKIKSVGSYIRDLKDKPFRLINERFKHQRSELEANLESKKATLWPALGLFADAGKVGTSDEMRTQSSVGLNLTWQIPWKGKDQAELQVIREQLSSNEIQHKIALQRASETVREKRLLLLQLYRQIELLDQQLELGKRQQALIQSRYASGNATIFELSQMENELLRLELDRSQKAGDFMRHSLDIGRLYDERALQSKVFETFY